MSATTPVRQARRDPACPSPRVPRPILNRPADDRRRVLRRRALWLLMVVLLAVVSGGAAVAVAQPSPVTPASCPQPGTSTPTPCPPAPPPSGHPQTPPSTTSSAPVTTAPNTTAPSPPPPVTPLSPPSGACGITDIGACVTDGINSFFWALVVAALNSLLRLVAQTLLATPRLDQLPRIGELWESSRGIAIASYALLIMVAGIVLMAYETLQARTTIRQTAPRIVVGFLAANLSLILTAKAIELTNALSYALVGGGVDPSGAAQTLSALLTNTVMNSINSAGLFGVLISLGLVVLLVALIGTYVVRVALTVMLVAGAPLLLICHGLEQTDGIARWWWRAFFGVLAIQVGQSLALITALRVFFAEGGFTLFGPTPDGVVNLIATGGLIWILVKIPSWVMQHVQLGGGRRTLLGSLVRAFVAYKTFGLLRGRGRSGSGRSRPTAGGAGGQGGNGGGGHGGSANPYAHVRATASGQYMLPLVGLRRSRPAARPKPAPAPKPPIRHGRQLTLPLGNNWPQNNPVLGRNGQYQLPLNVKRVKPTPPPVAPHRTSPTAGRRGGQQLELPFDPYRGNRPDRSGQYWLPLDGVRRTPRPPSPAPSPAPPPARARGTQLELPFDPYKGNRPTRSGQYPLPLDGVRRVSPATPAPAPPPPRLASPAARQLRLPLDLPTRPRRSSPPPPTPGGTP